MKKTAKKGFSKAAKASTGKKRVTKASVTAAAKKQTRREQSKAKKKTVEKSLRLSAVDQANIALYNSLAVETFRDPNHTGAGRFSNLSEREIAKHSPRVT